MSGEVSSLKPSDQFQIVDRRKRGIFWAENDIFEAPGHPLSPPAKLAYLCFCRMSNVGGVSFASHRRLAEMTGLSISSIQRAIIELLEMEIVERINLDGGPNTYHVIGWPSGGKTSVTQTEVVGQADRGGRSSCGKTSVTQTEVGRSHRPTKEVSDVGLLEEGLETTLSGSPPDDAHNGHRNYTTEAHEVLAFLNKKAGTRYEPVEANLRLIRARLKEADRPAWRLKQLVSVKAAEWPLGHDMRKYLRPATLFNREKCAQYLGQLPPPAVELASNLLPPTPAASNEHAR